MTKTVKPIESVQKELSRMDIHIPPHDKIRKMKNKTLLEYEKYYEMILEGLVGEQVWQILDIMELIYNIRKTRNKGK